MAEQFFTTCRYCGKQILMTRCVKNGKWIACDPEIRRFRPSGGPYTYITDLGEAIRGEHAYEGNTFGYRKHRKDCAK